MRTFSHDCHRLLQSETPKQIHNLILLEQVRSRKNSDGMEQWYYGNILTLISGNNHWFNVQHDGELFVDIQKGNFNNEFLLG